MDKFDLSLHRVRYIMNKFTGKASETVDEIAARVKKEIPSQFRIWRDPNLNGRESMILMVSEHMKRNYMKYYDCLCFDFTYRLVRKERFFNEFNEMCEE